MANVNVHIVRSIDLIYAHALVDMAFEQGALVEVAEQVEQIAELINTQPQFERLLASPTLTLEQRTGILDTLFKDRVHDLIYRFVMVLNRKGRLNLFTRIVCAFRKVYDQKFGKAPVEVYVAQPLGADEQNRVADRIGAALGREVVIHEHVDPSLIGGIRLRVGDQLVDGTVATQLRHMREEILESGRENARANLQRIVGE